MSKNTFKYLKTQEEIDSEQKLFEMITNLEFSGVKENFDETIKEQINEKQPTKEKEAKSKNFNNKEKLEKVSHSLYDHIIEKQNRNEEKGERIYKKDNNFNFKIGNDQYSNLISSNMKDDSFKLDKSKYSVQFVNTRSEINNSLERSNFSPIKRGEETINFTLFSTEKKEINLKRVNGGNNGNIQGYIQQVGKRSLKKNNERELQKLFLRKTIEATRKIIYDLIPTEEYEKYNGIFEFENHMQNKKNLQKLSNLRIITEIRLVPEEIIFHLLDPINSFDYFITIIDQKSDKTVFLTYDYVYVLNYRENSPDRTNCFIINKNKYKIYNKGKIKKKDVVKLKNGSYIVTLDKYRYYINQQFEVDSVTIQAETINASTQYEVKNFGSHILIYGLTKKYLDIQEVEHECHYVQFTEHGCGEKVNKWVRNFDLEDSSVGVKKLIFADNLKLLMILREDGKLDLMKIDFNFIYNEMKCSSILVNGYPNIYAVEETSKNYILKNQFLMIETYKSKKNYLICVSYNKIFKFQSDKNKLLLTQITHLTREIKKGEKVKIVLKNFLYIVVNTEIQIYNLEDLTFIITYPMYEEILEFIVLDDNSLMIYSNQRITLMGNYK